MLLFLLLCSHCYAYTLEIDKDFSTSAGVSNIKTGYDALMSLSEKNSPIFQLSSSIFISGIFIVLGHELFGHGSACRQLNIPCSYRIGEGSAGQTRYEYSSNPIKQNYIVIGGLEFQTQLKDKCLQDIIQKQSVTISDIVLSFHTDIEFLTAFTSFKADNCDLEQFTYTLKRRHSNSKIDNRTIKHYARLALLDPLPWYNMYFFMTNNNSYEPKKYPRIVPNIDCNLYPEGITNAYNLYFNFNNTLLKISYENGTTYEHRVEGGSISLLKTFSNYTLGGELKYVEDCTKSLSIELGYKDIFIKMKYYDVYYITDINTIAVGYNF